MIQKQIVPLLAVSDGGTEFALEHVFPVERILRRRNSMAAKKSKRLKKVKKLEPTKPLSVISFGPGTRGE
jgi:hypothetical protein